MVISPAMERLFFLRLHQLVMVSLLTLTTACVSFSNLPLTARKTDEPFSASLALSQNKQLAFRYIPKNMRLDQKIIATISLDAGRGKNTRTIFEIRKIPKGYAAEAPLYEAHFTKQNKMQANFSISVDKEHDLMAGFRVRWEF